MTIGCWIVAIIGIVILCSGLIIGGIMLNNDDTGEGIAIIIIAAFIGLGSVFGVMVYSRTESGKRAYKDQQSNFGGGIERIVEVYDVNGELVKTYEGKFDIETNADGKYIIFDDENNKRHQIYYTTGTVCIEEK